MESYDNDTYHEYQRCARELLRICVPTLLAPFVSWELGRCPPKVLFLALLSPALGLVFPDQPFWRGKSRFWSSRDHNPKGKGYFIAVLSC